MKSELVRLTRARNLALRDGREDEGERHQLSTLEAELRHLVTLAKYVQTASPAAGRELATWQAMASGHFDQLKNSGDVEAIRRWVTLELAPLLNKSEQAAHLVATTSRSRPKGPEAPFVWPVGVDRAL